MRTVLLVGGVDPSGLSGLAADIRAVGAHRVHAAPVVAALTSQNSRAVARVDPVDPRLLHAQLQAVLEDLPVAAVKIGLLGQAGAVEVLRAVLERLRGVPAVLDPVLGASTGSGLWPGGDGVASLRRLLPRVALLTPNAPEAAALSGLPVRTAAEAEHAARALRAAGAQAVLVKGGHFEGGDRGLDVLVSDRVWQRFSGDPIVASHTRGTGCTLASAIAARLARGESLPEAVAGARAFVRTGLRGGQAVGAGPGPVGARARVGRLHAIVDTPELARAAAAGGADVVQYREKRPLPTRELVARARAVCEAADAVVIVDDRADVAAEAGAQGVHLGRADLSPRTARDLLGPAALLGATANSVAEAREILARCGELVDYLGVGPVFGTRSKAEPAPPLGLAALAEVCSLSPVPVVAIGGITPAQVAEVLAAGAHGVAVLSGIAHAPDPRAAAAAYAAALGDTDD
jgi:hydroxymethylpyrimidine kinase / phosphomethylpyrimidine kinase / thiamine-phosphate diphosphorylase